MLGYQTNFPCYSWLSSMGISSCSSIMILNYEKEVLDQGCRIEEFNTSLDEHSSTYWAFLICFWFRVDTLYRGCAAISCTLATFPIGRSVRTIHSTLPTLPITVQRGRRWCLFTLWWFRRLSTWFFFIIFLITALWLWWGLLLRLGLFISVKIASLVRFK